MLNRLKVKNFKLLRDVELEIESSLPTVLIGPNASGKSTVIEVLDFLARSAADGLEAAIVAHGGVAAIRTGGTTEPIEIHSNWKFKNSIDKRSWNLSWILCISTTSNGRFSIASETLRDGDTDLLVTSADGVRTASEEPPGASTNINNSLVLAFESLVDEERYPSLFILRLLVEQVRTLGSVSSAPSWARFSSDRMSPRDPMIISTDSFVGREGIGLATALYNLQTDHIDAWGNLQRAFQAEFPSVKRIVFPADPGGSRISFALEDERFPRRKIYASEMSDGMIVYLCLLALILHPRQLAVLALDEPDAHLHPSAVRRLMALAHSSTKEHLHLVIVTHSNALLDELQDPAASIRIVENSKDGARIRKLDADALKAWRGEYTLSDMRRTGLLDPANTSYDTES